MTGTRSEILNLFRCVGGIYFSYLAFGYLQEKLYRKERGDHGEKFSYSLFLVFCQCVVNSVAARVVVAVRKPAATPVPFLSYARIAASYIGAMLSSNAALAFINYPTQVLGKSCKMIPVMLMGIVINGKRYKRKEYFQVACISIGIALFMGFQATSKKGGELRVEGVVLLIISLLLDGFTGPMQERVITKFSPTVHQMMFSINWIAAVLCLAGLLFQGTLIPAVEFCFRFPDVAVDIVLFCILSAIGQNFIFATLFCFNSLVLTTVTTTRKFFTILVSVLWVGNAVSMVQWLGVVLVFSGLGLNIHTKYQHRLEKTRTAKKKE